MAISLKNAGYEVLQTDNGEAALEMVQSEPERSIHLLITDMVMPRVGGNELASRLQSIAPKMRILFCSAFPREKVVQDTPACETIPFLSKPFTNAMFLGIVAALLRGA